MNPQAWIVSMLRRRGWERATARLNPSSGLLFLLSSLLSRPSSPNGSPFIKGLQEDLTLGSCILSLPFFFGSQGYTRPAGSCIFLFTFCWTEFIISARDSLKIKEKKINTRAKKKRKDNAA